MPNPNNPHGFLFEKNLAGVAVVLERGKTTSNATISIGDPLVRVAGQSAPLNNGIKLAGATSVALFGVAVEAVTGAAGAAKSVAFIPALQSYVFSAQVGSTVNITAGYLGKKFGIVGTTNGKIRLSTTATTSVVQLVGLKPGSAWGTYAELLFIVCKSSYGTA